MKRKSLPTGRDFLFVEGYGNENPGAFQSTRPLRGATVSMMPTVVLFWNFNPRAPCGARPSRYGTDTDYDLHFNPRAPCGARPLDSRSLLNAENFNPRAPCGARLICVNPLLTSFQFQSTRPLRGATGAMVARHTLNVFQSTRPLRGATTEQQQRKQHHPISIHAPLAGRDRP